MTEVSTGADAATEPMSFEQMAESLIEPEAEEEAQDDHAETTDAPDTQEDQTEDGDDDRDAEDADDGEQDDEDEETEVESEAQTFTVKVDGKEEQVSLEELQRGYSGQKYIQQGMQEVAEARKQVQTFAQSMQQQQQQLDHLIQAAQQGGFTLPQPPDQTLLQSDPFTYMQQRAVYDEQMAAYNQNVAAYQQHQEHQARQQHEEQQSYLQREKAALIEALPDLGDPAKGPALAAKMQDAALNAYGFDQQELAEVTDSRMLRVLHDAARFRELMSQKDKAAKKAEKARPVAKAGAKTDQKSGQARKKRDRLKQTGSIDDAMGLMLNGD